MTDKNQNEGLKDLTTAATTFAVDMTTNSLLGASAHKIKTALDDARDALDAIRVRGVAELEALAAKHASEEKYAVETLKLQKLAAEQKYQEAVVALLATERSLTQG